MTGSGCNHPRAVRVKASRKKSFLTPRVMLKRKTGKFVSKVRHRQRRRGGLSSGHGYYGGACPSHLEWPLVQARWSRRWSWLNRAIWVVVLGDAITSRVLGDDGNQAEWGGRGARLFGGRGGGQEGASGSWQESTERERETMVRRMKKTSVMGRTKKTNGREGRTLMNDPYMRLDSWFFWGDG